MSDKRLIADGVADKPFAMITLDMDNLWCYQRSFGQQHWQDFGSFFPVVIPRMLRFFKKLNLNLTIFLIGKDAEVQSHIPLIQELVSQGHEIANHSFLHREDLHMLSEQSILQDIQASHVAIEKACSVKPVGYRGPAFGISTDTIKTLKQMDYRYDSSSFYSSLQGLAKWHHGRKSASNNVSLSQYSRGEFDYRSLMPATFAGQGGKLWEIPVSTFPVLRTPFHGTYLNYLGQYSEALAMGYVGFALRAMEKKGYPLNFLLHATDFLGADDTDALAFLPGMKRASGEKLFFMQQVLMQIQRRFTNLKMTDFIERYQGPVEQLAPNGMTN